MQRKLIQLSPSTAVVSLPSRWIKKNNLKKGALIAIDEKENDLLITTKKESAETEITIDVKGFSEDLLWRYIDAAYISGYDTITILTSNEQSNWIPLLVKWFPAMMIIEERKDYFVLRDVAKDSKGDIQKIVSRIFNMMINTIEDAIDANKKKDFVLLSALKKRDYHINSYINYAHRQINKFGYEPYSKGAIMHTYLKILEILSDKICNLFTCIGNEKQDIDTNIINEILLYVRHVQKAHFKFDRETLLDVDSLQEKFKEIISKSKSNHYSLSELASAMFDLEEVIIQLNV